MRVTIRLFARLRELAGAGELSREVPAGATVNGVWQGLVRDFPAMAPYEASLSCAVNAEYARFKTPSTRATRWRSCRPSPGGSGGRTLGLGSWVLGPGSWVLRS